MLHMALRFTSTTIIFRKYMPRSSGLFSSSNTCRGFTDRTIQLGVEALLPSCSDMSSLSKYVCDGCLIMLKLWSMIMEVPDCGAQVSGPAASKGVEQSISIQILSYRSSDFDCPVLRSFIRR